MIQTAIDKLRAYGSPNTAVPFTHMRDAATRVNGAATGRSALAYLRPSYAGGPFDLHSVMFAVMGSFAFFAIGVICLSLARFDLALASIWLPNACVVAVLLVARLRNEMALYVGIAIASIAANIVGGNGVTAALFFTLANLVDIALVVGLTRVTCEGRPNFSDLGDVARFAVIGGFVGPLISAGVAAFGLGPDPAIVWAGVASWFHADSAGMMLTVPAILLTADALPIRQTVTPQQFVWSAALLIGGLAAATAVFVQHQFPLLFLIPPITLLIAFQLGVVGTALFVPGVALVATYMTYIGVGPIVENATTDVSKMYVIQAFIAANFLIGLPVAATLTGRARIAVELERRQDELALFADNISDAVLQIDRHGVYTYASRSVREVLGRPPSAFVGQRVVEQTHEDANERISDVLERLLSGEAERERLTYRRMRDDEHGAPVFIEADCVAAFDQRTGERDGVIVCARDVTERVELELLLTRARRRAENAVRTKARFLANMSHEIRTPMNGVLGFAELMLQDELEPEHRQHIEMIVRSGRSMMLLLNDILDLSKIEAGQIAIQTGPVDLVATLTECIALQRPNAEKKGLDLALTKGRDPKGTGTDKTALRPFVLTDALRLRQIVLNLLGNAVKFTEEGGVELRYWADATTIGIEVVDTGIGISGDRLKTIFKAFTQAENTTSRRFGGTGLGLTISRQLAQLLGGSIEVESVPGDGSRFRLLLPANYATPEECRQVVATSRKSTEMPRPARILLVEDHDVNRLLATEMLERCGQSVAVAHDGNEAIAMVVDSMMRADPYDLVLMDIQMPGCDGYAATRAIRAEGITPHALPIVALTANAFPEDIAAARESGMQAHLAKPLVFADLARTLQRWLPTRIVEASRERSSGAMLENADSVDEYGEPGPSDRPSTTLDEPRASPSSLAPSASQAVAPATSPVPDAPAAPSNKLEKRWRQRRGEAIAAVREALDNGTVADAAAAPNADTQNTQGTLVPIMHKLAGSAAMFAEPELGEHAAMLERALRMNEPRAVCDALAVKLLAIADDLSNTEAAETED